MTRLLSLAILLGLTGCATVNPVCLFNCHNGLAAKPEPAPSVVRGPQSVASRCPSGRSICNGAGCTCEEWNGDWWPNRGDIGGTAIAQ